jgi:hypothetical protein
VNYHGQPWDDAAENGERYAVFEPTCKVHFPSIIQSYVHVDVPICTDYELTTAPVRRGSTLG